MGKLFKVLGVRIVVYGEVGFHCPQLVVLEGRPHPLRPLVVTAVGAPHARRTGSKCHVQVGFGVQIWKTHSPFTHRNSENHEVIDQLGTSVGLPDRFAEAGLNHFNNDVVWSQETKLHPCFLKRSFCNYQEKKWLKMTHRLSSKVSV